MQDIEQTLQSAGLKATTPRVKVLEFFHGSKHRHFSAEEVFRHLVEEKIDIGLATVYRALAQLVEAGILSSGTLGSTTAVFELNEGKRHDHVICLNCGRVDEFFDPLIEARQKTVAEELGYLLSGHHLVLHGYCRDCRPTKSRPEGKKGRG
ncbi:Fur family transcriptional regulator [Paraburkholderia sp. BCC1885]|uniref:Fur family transcriptional regulator n=1 Tax=Paraburkholderia sp. BCC1885 TaxID=2562669 RepID=UPI0011836EC2|nr:Fur family transcriptional regulator [Paraburkholderia sp. BCC1885]